MYFLKEGLKNMTHNRMMTLASIGVLIAGMLLTGTAALFSMNVKLMIEEVGDTNITSVYLKDDIKSEEDAMAIGEELNKLGNVSTVEFYSRDEAIKEYREALGEEVFANMQGDNNPLPHVFKITLSDISKYEETMAQVMAIEGVDSVGNRSEVAGKLTDLNETVTNLSFWIVIALGLISLFVISNTIRMSMYSRRFEISIMKSVGATNSFVRIPFIIEGMVIGFISGIIASVIMYFLYDVLVSALNNIFVLNTIPFMSVLVYIIVGFIVAGMAIGAFGGAISIRKHLKKEGKEVLNW